MKQMEIGSFIELQLPHGHEFHHEADTARLNHGRGAIYHAFRLTGCKALWLPRYQCDTVRDFLRRKGVAVRYYDIDRDFTPRLEPEQVAPEEAVLLVNYYGVMGCRRMTALARRFDRVILDNAQGFFAPPIDGCYQIYSARKFCGVPDGAYVIGEGANRFVSEYEQDFSSDTASFLLERMEYGCEGKAYASRTENEHRLDQEDVRRMSALTRQLLDAEDAAFNQAKRRENFATACALLDRYNALDASRYLDADTVPMVYPLLVEDDRLLPWLQKHKLFQGHWWSYLLDEVSPDSAEAWLSRYIIPITIDQRYGAEELKYTQERIREYLEG